MTDAFFPDRGRIFTGTRHVSLKVMIVIVDDLCCIILLNTMHSLLLQQTDNFAP